LETAAKVEHANQLAAALQMDMRDWFTPTVENFFGRVSKLQIANALTEARNPLQPQDSKTQKGELAAIAAKRSTVLDGSRNRFVSVPATPQGKQTPSWHWPSGEPTMRSTRSSITTKGKNKPQLEQLSNGVWLS
jgi:hypothetical protein